MDSPERCELDGGHHLWPCEIQNELSEMIDEPVNMAQNHVEKLDVEIEATRIWSPETRNEISHHRGGEKMGPARPEADLSDQDPTHEVTDVASVPEGKPAEEKAEGIGEDKGKHEFDHIDRLPNVSGEIC